MRTRTPLATVVVIAASMPLSMALAAGQASSGPPREDGACTPASRLDQARTLLTRGECVSARSVAQRVLTHEGTSLTEGERDRAFKLWSEADAAVQKANPLDISLQKSRIALDEGDVRTAERHARAVLSSATAGPERTTEAQSVLDASARRRDELAPLVPEALAQAEADFSAGRYAQAKAGIAMVDRSGVELGAEQRALLASCQTRIVEIERQQGRAFEIDGMAGVFQPGVVRRREEPAQPPPAQPAPAQPPVELPGAPAAQPPAQEPAAQEPPAQPLGDDLINQALRFEAQNILAEADRSFAESRYNDAQTRYVQLRSQYQQFLTPDQLKHVEDRLKETMVRLGSGGRGIPELLGEQKLRHDAALAAYENYMDQADRALSTGDSDRARQLVAQARLSVSQERDTFRESELEGLYNRADQLRAKIASEEQRIAAENARLQDEAIRKASAEQAKVAREERARKINELLDRARAYQAEMKYRDALQAVDQLLFLDPINPAGLLLRDLYGAIIVYQEFNALQREKSLSLAENSLDNQRAVIPARNIVNYPRDWPAISLARGETVAFGDSPDNRRTFALLDSPEQRIPNVDFADNALADVVAFIHDFTRIDVDVDWGSLEVAGIGKDSTVSLRLTNATPRTVLDRVLSKLGDGTATTADWMVRDGVVVIGSDEFIRRHTALAIYDVSDLIVEIPDYDQVPQIDLQSVLQSTGGSGGGSGGRSPFRDDQQDQQQGRERDRDGKMDEIIAIVTDNVDYDGWQDNGGSTGKITKLVNQGQLIITNTPKNHAAIEGLLGKLRAQRAMQINVETRFLLVSQDFFEQIGFDVDVIVNANNNQVRTARANAPAFQPKDVFRLDAQGQIGRTVTSPGLGPTAGGTPPSVTQGLVNPRSWSPIGFLQDSLGIASGLAPTQGIAADILGAAPALGIAGQFLDDVQVDFLVVATQADRRSVSLTAPRVTFTNGQTSNIFVATQVAFVSDLTPVVGDSAVGFDPTVDVVSEGVTLLVTGTVTSDRRYVTMNVDAGVSRIDGFANQAVTAVAGGQLINSADTQSFIQLPTVTVTRVQTTVTVPDQGTILLGGQRIITEFEVEAGVPVLSKIPIINRFFTNRIESKEEQTLLILVKPTILIQNEEEERNFPGLNEQIRFGG